jgi:catechol 2,3-dioxygenase-like lactoylglutathione lyase family enzyme
MTRLCPVLSVKDPTLALAWFDALPGVATDRGRGLVHCGDLTLRIATVEADLPGLRVATIDHLAFRVTNVDALLDVLRRAGVPLHPAFTPDTPREIAEFWDSGVRYVFVQGPEGVPVEFCALRGAASTSGLCTGLDHLGLRVAATDAACLGLIAGGAKERARHHLPTPNGTVEVRFLAERNLIWEVFDEPVPQALDLPAAGTGWIGTIPLADG